MPFNGAGSYSPPGADFPAVANTLIESTKFNNVVNDIATALSLCITKDGQQTVTANIPFGGFALTGVGSGLAARTRAPNVGDVQDSSANWAGTAGGTADAITLTLAPAITAYAAGQSFMYKSGAAANTGAMTVAINGLTTKAIQKNGAALAAADHPADRWFRITYDGAAFQLEQLEIGTGYLALAGGTMTGAIVFAAAQTLPNFNWSFNTDFRIWGAGTATVPTGWTANGASATYAKNTTAAQYKWGNAGFQVTRVGTDCYGSQDIDTIPGFGPVGAWLGKTVTFGAWVYATVASRARLSINDGVGTSNSAYHSGGSTLEYLTVTRTLDAAATKVQLRCGVDTGNTAAVFSGAALVLGSQLNNFIPPGWRGRKSLISVAPNATLGAGETKYWNCSIDGSIDKKKMGFKCVMRNLYVGCNGTPGAGQSYTTYVRKNAADTALVATISDTNDNNLDTTNEIVFVASDTFAVKFAASGGMSGLWPMWSVEIEEVPL